MQSVAASDTFPLVARVQKPKSSRAAEAQQLNLCTDLEADVQARAEWDGVRASIWINIRCTACEDKPAALRLAVQREKRITKQPRESQWLRWSGVSPRINCADSRPPSLTHSLLSAPPLEHRGPASSTENELQFMRCLFILFFLHVLGLFEKILRNRIIPIKHSPEHVRRTEDHIKLPAVEARGFLCHLGGFQQTRLFQQKLTWQDEERTAPPLKGGGRRRLQVLPLALVEQQPGRPPWYNNTIETSATRRHSDSFVQVSRPWWIRFFRMKPFPAEGLRLITGIGLPQNEMGRRKPDGALTRGRSTRYGPGWGR